jgi:TonB family protein
MPPPLTFELALLPERKTNWRRLAGIYTAEIVMVLLLLGLRLVFPDELSFTRPERITELIPLPSGEPDAVKIEPQPVTPLAPPPPRPIAKPKLVVPPEIVAKPKPVEAEPPKIEVDFKPPQLKQVPPPQPKVIYTGSFGSSAPPTITAPVEKVQTGGFGDPNGVPGDGKQNSHLTVASLGSFDLPPGAGKGNGVGGGNGTAGVTASSGFGSGIAQTQNPKNTATVQTAGFTSQEVARGTAPKTSADNGPAMTPVAILAKPNPAYSDEARALKIEGEVLLEVRFGANGSLQVIRVVQGLGHGLDENAMVAAKKISFKPAMRNGVAVDSTSIVHVVFQLAY